MLSRAIILILEIRYKNKLISLLNRVIFYYEYLQLKEKDMSYLITVFDLTYSLFHFFLFVVTLLVLLAILRLFIKKLFLFYLRFFSLLLQALLLLNFPTEQRSLLLYQTGRLIRIM